MKVGDGGALDGAHGVLVVIVRDVGVGAGKDVNIDADIVQRRDELPRLELVSDTSAMVYLEEEFVENRVLPDNNLRFIGL